MLGREVVEGQQYLSVLDQIRYCLVVFHALGLDEEVKCSIRFGLRFGRPDVV